MTERPPSLPSLELPPGWQEQLKSLEHAAREFRERLANEIVERILQESVKGVRKTPQRIRYSISFPTWAAYVEEVLRQHYSYRAQLLSAGGAPQKPQKAELSVQGAIRTAIPHRSVHDALARLRGILRWAQSQLEEELRLPGSVVRLRPVIPRQLRLLIAQVLVPPVFHNVRNALQGQQLRATLLASIERTHPSIVEALFYSDTFRRSTLPLVLYHIEGFLRKMDSAAQRAALKRFEAEQKRPPLEGSRRDQYLVDQYYLETLLELLTPPCDTIASSSLPANDND